MTWEHRVNSEQKELVDQVMRAFPKEWGGVIVLARKNPDNGRAEFLTGGVRLDRKSSVEVLRAVLAELEKVSPC